MVIKMPHFGCVIGIFSHPFALDYIHHKLVEAIRIDGELCPCDS